MPDPAAFARLAVEYWKLLRAFERTCERVQPDHAARTTAQARFSATRLDAMLREAGMSLVVFDGQRFEAGLPAAAVNGEDFAGVDDLTVESTIEPAIVHGTHVLAMGKVIVTQGGSDASGH